MIEQLKEKADAFMNKNWTFLQDADCYEFLSWLTEEEKSTYTFLNKLQFLTDKIYYEVI